MDHCCRNKHHAAQRTAGTAQSGRREVPGLEENTPAGLAFANLGGNREGRLEPSSSWKRADAAADVGAL